MIPCALRRFDVLLVSMHALFCGLLVSFLSTTFIPEYSFAYLRNVKVFKWDASVAKPLHFRAARFHMSVL